MAKIKKLIEDNVIHYPATITDAVKNPNNGKTVTEELTELGSEVSGIKEINISVKYNPTNGASQKVAVFDIVKGAEYTITRGLSILESDSVYFGIMDSSGNTIKSLNSIKQGPYKDVLTFDKNYVGAALYVSYYHEPQQGQVLSVEVFKDGMYPKIADFKKTEDIVNKLNSHVEFHGSIVGQGNILVESQQIFGCLRNRLYRVDIDSNIDLSGVTVSGGYTIFAVYSYDSNGNKSVLTNITTEMQLSDYYTFVVPDNSVYIKLQGRFTKDKVFNYEITDNDSDRIKKELSERIDKINNEVDAIKGVDISVKYNPTNGASQKVAVFDIVKGAEYTITRGLSILESDSVYFGIMDSSGNTIKSLNSIKQGPYKDVLTFDKNYVGAALYVSYYHEPQQGQVLSVEVVSTAMFASVDDLKELSGSMVLLDGKISTLNYRVDKVTGLDIEDNYIPIYGGGQTVTRFNITKGVKTTIIARLSRAESEDVYMGVRDSDGNLIQSLKTIYKGSVESVNVLEFDKDFQNAYIYTSYYHEPAQNQSIRIEVVSDSIFDSDSFSLRTKDQFSLASNLGFGRQSTWVGDYMPEGWIPQLVFLHISDTHENAACSNNAISALNRLSVEGLNKGNCAKFLIHTGDIKTENYLSDFSYWNNARSKAKKSVFHVVGNHDCGLNNVVATSGTDEQVYASNTEPFIEEWDLTTSNEGTSHPNGKNYYFKDFSDEKVRLIVLYEYEHDMEVSSTDSSVLKYSRVYRAFRQEQIDWLIDSLMTTPSGWGVVIAKHQMEYADDDNNSFNSYFLRGKREQNTYVGEILPDIVQAFIDGTTINKSYQQTGAVVTTLNAIADFSKKKSNAEFICYLSGHTHLDSIHYLRDYPTQLELTIGCDNTNYTHGSDMNQVAGTKTEDVINVCSLDRNRGYIYVVRIGSDMSYTGQRRDILSIKYRK